MKVTHDGVTNKFSFIHEGNKVTLKPLTPKEFLEDQIKMKQKRKEKKDKEKERKKEKKVKKNKSEHESLLVGRKSLKKVLLNRKELSLLLPTDMCLMMNSL
ncbi:hypothetical protein CR513_13523, partial [Mucuna pruriens]